MSGHDEESVIDTDRKADHQREGRRDARHLDEPADELDAEHAGADTDEGGDQRQSRGNQGAKRHQEHEEGNADTNHFRETADLRDLGHRRTTELNLKPKVTSRFRGGGNGIPGLRGDFVRRQREDDISEPDSLALRDGQVRDCDDTFDGCRLFAGRADGFLRLGIRQRHPVRRGVDDANRSAGRGRNLFRQQIVRLLGFDTGNRELGCRLASHRRAKDADDREYRDPDQHNRPSTPGNAPRHVIEPSRHWCTSS